ncbi:hypothetical protein [Virgibacillus halodenitrificans]|uniref:hypothetical protein n=1 Tax=Virgibacillus halodenitrificans TaxID=1482 RepID=UPI002DBD801B|nr:hypothetical protein [Virgibacillus halodenitrificans]MEC2158700.1 hypothetical protein [Virgibacillus halodenitrificans]
MGEEHSITVRERILASEDFSHKKDTLMLYKNNLETLDKDFFTLVNGIIINEEQKGEVVEAMQQKTKTFRDKNENLLSQLDTEITRISNTLDDQIDDMKTQRMTITYEDTPST